MQPQTKKHCNRACIRWRAIGRQCGDGARVHLLCGTKLLHVLHKCQKVEGRPSRRLPRGPLLARGLAAVCVKTVLQPFDTIKTVQQFSTSK